MLETIQELIPLLLPIILIDLGFRIYAILDIIKEERRVRGNNKIIWLVLIAIVNFGWAIYFLFGREDA